VSVGWYRPAKIDGAPRRSTVQSHCLDDRRYRTEKGVNASFEGRDRRSDRSGRREGAGGNDGHRTDRAAIWIALDSLSDRPCLSNRASCKVSVWSRAVVDFLERLRERSRCAASAPANHLCRTHELDTASPGTRRRRREISPWRFSDLEL